jgi:hypothetical protein
MKPILHFTLHFCQVDKSRGAKTPYSFDVILRSEGHPKFKLRWNLNLPRPNLRDA